MTFCYVRVACLRACRWAMGYKSVCTVRACPQHPTRRLPPASPPAHRPFQSKPTPPPPFSCHTPINTAPSPSLPPALHWVWFSLGWYLQPPSPSLSPLLVGPSWPASTACAWSACAACAEWTRRSATAPPAARPSPSACSSRRGEHGWWRRAGVEVGGWAARACVCVCTKHIQFWCMVP